MSAELVIIRSRSPLSAETMARIGEAGEQLTARLAASPDPVPFVIDGDLVVYYLRPGESTELLDAKAEAIRSGQEAPA